MKVPGFHLPRYITLDYVHIFHLGYGMDIGASSIVLLAKLGHFGTMRSFPERLDAAYQRFDTWCKEVQRTSSILRFSKEGFDMKDIRHACNHAWSHLQDNNDWPTSLGGKAFDTGLVIAWIEHDLAADSGAGAS